MSNLKLVINNSNKEQNQRYFFEKKELKIILDLYAKMVSEGSWKDYGLSISSKRVSFSIFKNAAEKAIYNISKNFKPSNKNLKYLTHPFDFREDSFHKSKTLAGKEILELEFMKL